MLKVGVIGTGFISAIHLESIHRTYLGKVVALAGNDPEKTELKAREFQISKWYTDYRELLQDDEIDIVHICTPNNLHFPMAKDTLLAGKHVVLEKPLTLERKQGQELVDLANKTGLVNAVNFNVRFYPLVAEARQRILNGSIGNIFAIQGSYLQDWLFYEADYSWRLQPELSGESRAIADIGSHWLDLIEYISQQKVVEVLADFETFHKTRKKPSKPYESWSNKLIQLEDYEEVPIHTEDYATVLLRFENGTKGVFTVNQMAAGHKNRVFFEINGSKSSLIWDSQRPNEMMIGYRDRPNEILLRDPALVQEDARNIISYPGGHNEGFPDTFKQHFKEIYQYILTGQSKKGIKPTFPTFFDGYREMVLCEAIVKSSKTGLWTAIE